MLLSGGFARYGVSVPMVLDLVWLLVSRFDASFGLVGWCCGFGFPGTLWVLGGLSAGCLRAMCFLVFRWFSGCLWCGVFRVWAGLLFGGFVYFVVWVVLICDFLATSFWCGRGIVSDF